MIPLQEGAGNINKLAWFLYDLAGLSTPEIKQVKEPAEFLHAVNIMKSKGAKTVHQIIADAVISKLAQPAIDALQRSNDWINRDVHYKNFWKPTQSKWQDGVLRLVQESFHIPANTWSHHPHYSDLSWKHFTYSFSDVQIPDATKCYFELIDPSYFTGACFFEGVALILTAPDTVHYDGRGLPHSEEEHAVIYADSGICAWHGLWVPEHYILEKHSITRKDIIEEKNAERRRALLEILGASKFAELLDVITIEQSIDRKGNLQSLYRTREKDVIAGNYLYFAQVTCPSTRRNYFLSVPPHLRSAQEAVAWTFGLPGAEYAPEEET